MPAWIEGSVMILAMVLIVGALLVVPIRLGFSLRFLPDVLDIRLLIGSVRPILGSIPIPLHPIVPVINPHQTSHRDENETPRHGQEGQSSSSSFGKLLKFTGVFLSSVRSIDILEWHTKIGSGDAATTSYLIGGLWAVKSTLVGWLRSRYVFLSQPLYSAVPDYETAGLALEVRCIFRFTIGEIILALVKRSLPHGPRG